MKALLAAGVEPRLALQGYDVIAQWDKCLLRLPDCYKKCKCVSDFRSRVRVRMYDCMWLKVKGKGKIQPRTDHVGPKGE